PATGAGLWRSDGTAAGTTLVKSFGPGGVVSLGMDVNGTLFFTADDGTSGNELWKSDGTTAGTTLVTDIFPGTSRTYDRYGYYLGEFPNSSNPSYFTNVNGTLFFTADDGAYSRGLWKSDGTEAGTVLVEHIIDFAGNSLTNVNGTLFFWGDD